MTPEITELFARYNEYFDQLDEDVQQTSGPLTKSELNRESGRRLTLQQFEEMWTKICEDPRLKEAWLHRLLGGYQQAREELRQSLNDAFGTRLSS